MSIRKLLTLLTCLYFLPQVCGCIILGFSIWIRVSSAQQVNACSHTSTMQNMETTAYTLISYLNFHKFSGFVEVVCVGEEECIL